MPQRQPEQSRTYQRVIETALSGTGIFSEAGELVFQFGNILEPTKVAEPEIITIGVPKLRTRWDILSLLLQTEVKYAIILFKGGHELNITIRYKMSAGGVIIPLAESKFEKVKTVMAGAVLQERKAVPLELLQAISVVRAQDLDFIVEAELSAPLEKGEIMLIRIPGNLQVVYNQTYPA